MHRGDVRSLFAGCPGSAAIPRSGAAAIMLLGAVWVCGCGRGPTAAIAASAVPATPTGLRAENIDSTSLRVSWDTSARATAYSLYASTSMSWPSEIYHGTSTSYVHRNLARGTTYSYQVQASNAYGQSGYSNTVLGHMSPTTPTSLAVGNATTSSLTISWDASWGATSYQLFRASALNGAFGIIYDGDSTHFVDAGLAGGTAYYYSVQATRVTRASARSSPVSGSTMQAVGHG